MAAAPARGAGDAALASLLALQPWTVAAAADALARTGEGLADAAHVLDGYEPQWRGGARLAAEGARERRGEALRTASGAFHGAAQALRRHADLMESALLRAAVISRDVGVHDEAAATGGGGPELASGRAGLLRQAAAHADAVASSGRAAALALGAAAQQAPEPAGLYTRIADTNLRMVTSFQYGLGEVAADAYNMIYGVSMMGAGLVARTTGAPLSEQERRADLVYRRRTAAAWEVAKDDPAAFALAMVNLPLLRSDPTRWLGNLGPGGLLKVVGGAGKAAGAGARAGEALTVAGRGGAVSVAGAAREGAAVFARERRAALAEHPLPVVAPRRERAVPSPEPPSLPDRLPAAVAVPVAGAVVAVRRASRAVGDAAGGAVARASQAGRVAAVGVDRAVGTAGGVGRAALASAGRVADAGVGGAGSAGVAAGRALESATREAASALRRAGLAVTEDVGAVVVHLEEVSWTQGLLALEVLGKASEGLGGVTAMVGGLVGGRVRGSQARGWTLMTRSGVRIAWPVRPSPLAATAVATTRLQLRRTAELLVHTHVAGASVRVGGWSVARLGSGVLVAQRLGLLPPGGVRGTIVWVQGAAGTVAGAGGLATRNAQAEQAAVALQAERLERELVLREAAGAPLVGPGPGPGSGSGSGSGSGPGPGPGPGSGSGPSLAPAPRALVGVG